MDFVNKCFLIDLLILIFKVQMWKNFIIGWKFWSFEYMKKSIENKFLFHFQIIFLDNINSIYSELITIFSK